MAEQRLRGVFDWYKQNGDNSYGVIIGENREEYFAHMSGHPAIDHPRQGMLVTFLARPRSRGKQGKEAFDVQLDTAAQPVKPRAGFARPSIEARLPSSADVQLAAQEALRLKRLRRDGLAEQPIEDLSPGTRVVHPLYGTGVVVLANRSVVSIRLDRQPNRIIDVDRREVAKSIEQPPQPKLISEAAPQAVTKSVAQSTPAKAGSTISAYLRQLAADVQQALIEEGMTDNGIYKFEAADEPASAPQPIAIDPRVAAAFRTVSNITVFYSHQIQSRQALLQGQHVIISTPTASGKTEAYNPTILETLLADPRATALYVFPLVALGLDQTDRLEKLNNAFEPFDRLEIGIYNGSISPEKKDRTRRAANRILVTTPDSLHYIFLPKPYPNWRNFYRNLRYVVIDEAHIYKGVLGANMANIIRRLLIRCRREGNPRFPQIIISSATVLHPAQLAHQLTGLPSAEFEVITENGAPRPGRHFLVTRSDIHDLDTLCGELLNTRTIDARTNESRFVSTIVFMRSINEVKASARALRDALARTGRRHEAELVAEFYSDKGDKVDVLARLRRGEIRCVFTTTALMAGIDIGALDVAIVKHFPGLIMDARQMFGRAGRASEGAVIFIANRTDPFDQFYFDRPQQLFQGPIEDVIANPENPVLLAAHLKCAAQAENAQYNQEGPLPGQWTNLFGQMGQDLLASLVSLHTLRIQFGSYYLNTEDPHELEPLANLRSVGSETYSLKSVDDCQLLEEKREATAFRDAHPAAIVWVNGQSYQVVAFDKVTRDIKCQPIVDKDIRTRGLEELEIEVLSIDPPATVDFRLGSGVTINNGALKITTSVQEYLMYKSHTVMQCRSRACRYESPNLETTRCPQCGSPVRPKQVEDIIDKFLIPTPPELSRTLKTRGCWLELPESLEDRFDHEFWPRWISSAEGSPVVVGPDFEFAIHSVEHAILKAFPEYIRCDRDEIGSVYQLDVLGTPDRLYIYDNFEGGLGLSDEFIYEARTLLEGALDIIERCTCIDDQGCPVCLSYFGCHTFNQSLSKLAGRYVLQALLGRDTSKVIGDLKDYVNVYIPPSLQMNLSAGLPQRIAQH